MTEIDYQAAASAIKRISVELKSLVQPVRRLGALKSVVERRSDRLGAAAELAGIVARVSNLAAQIIGDREEDSKITRVRDELRAGAQTILDKLKQGN